jgi:LuxR family maltose regulon positive regulatory protein
MINTELAGAQEVAMQTALLATKLYFPTARAALVPRPRLIERLQAGLQCPLTLISSQAGSGKTTLLSEWHSGPGAHCAAAWLSLDNGDNDPARFFQHLVASLDLIQPGILQEILSLLQTLEPLRPEVILTPLVNALVNYPQDFILVLDDYHVIETVVIHAALTFLLDHLPPHMHLVLLTRADPPLPLARMRARSQLIEIRADHLRFSMDEAAQFLNRVMGLKLSGDQVAALEKRTEGWVAGLQLAALSMQGRDDVQGFVSAFTGSNHYIVDYLAEEVLCRQSEPLREFLLKTSILERFNGALCDALTGQADGEAVLEGLDHDNLFLIPLDNDQSWYRYHQLFADLLRSRLLHSHPGLAVHLHIRASEWFDENGFPDEAINHALEAKDFARAARLFCRDQLQVMYTRNISTLERWLRAFPEAFILADPRLCIARAHVLWSAGRRSELATYSSGTLKALDLRQQSEQTPEEKFETNILRGEAYTFQALIAMGSNHFTEAIDLAQQALRILPETTRHRAFALGCLYVVCQLSGEIDRSAQTCRETVEISRALNYPSMHATAAYTLAQALRVQGHLHQSVRMLQEALDYSEHQGQARLFYNGILHIGLAETLYEWNALDEMERELQAGISLAKQGGMNILVVIGLFNQSLLIHARGDTTGAMGMLEQIKKDCIQMDPATYLDTYRIYRLRWQAEQGNLDGLAEWVNQVDLNVENKVGIERFRQLYLAARFLCTLGRCDEALQILEKLEKTASEAKYLGWQIFIHVLQAVVWKKKDKLRAMDCLRQALELAEPEGYVRIFLNYGEPIRELLQSLLKHVNPPAYAVNLLTAFTGKTSPKSPASPRTTAEILSKREIELLGLIADGQSNKEIAAGLVISIGTVKRHTVNIFNKLDVKNRTEAVARARELGLL